MAYSRVQRAVSLCFTIDYLPYATINTPAFRAMLHALDPQAPDLGRKSVTTEVCIRICFLLRFMLILFHLYFLVANAAGAAVQITWLYNSGVERLKNEEDWPCVRPAFTCDLWKSVTNKEYFTYTAHWVQDKVGGGLELKRRVVTT